jgi:two-component system nitrate/nitrite response regulator NarL
MMDEGHLGNGGAPSGNGRVRILLADAHSLFREAVRMALDGQPDLRVVAEARDGLQAVAEAEQNNPDVALLDASLPNCDGVRATELIGTRVPECRVVVVSNEEDGGLLMSAVLAGAKGFLTKGSPLGELIGTARGVAEGETRIPPRMLGLLIDRLVRRRQEHDQALKRISRLTRREKEVLGLLAEGGDNDAIAQALVISPQTARTHVQNVLGKLGVHSRLEAAALARRNEVVEELSEAGY